MTIVVIAVIAALATTALFIAIMAKLSELAVRITAIETVLNKVKTEVEALKSALGDVDLPPEAEAALARLEAVAKSIDDLNPDAPEAPANP